jgi:hypothetical protein
VVVKQAWIEGSPSSDDKLLVQAKVKEVCANFHKEIDYPNERPLVIRAVIDALAAVDKRWAVLVPSLCNHGNSFYH